MTTIPQGEKGSCAAAPEATPRNGTMASSRSCTTAATWRKRRRSMTFVLVLPKDGVHYSTLALWRLRSGLCSWLSDYSDHQRS